MKRSLLIGMLVFVLVFMVACQPANIEPASPVDPQSPTEQPLPVEPDGGIGGEQPLPVEPNGGIGDELPAAVRAAISTLSMMLNAPLEAIEVLSFEQVDWPDGCLGVVRPEVACIAQVTPGYTIVLQYQGKNYEFHTNLDGTAITPAFEASAEGAEIGQEAAKGALVEALNILRDQIKVVSATPAEFSTSCLGVDVPGVACADVITPGTIVILEAEGRQYEYHVSMDGSVAVPAGVALNWHREGGIAGFNDTLVVFHPNAAHLNSESGGSRQAAAMLDSVLSEEQMAQWQEWLSRYGQVDIVLDDKATADRMITTLSFTGFGSEQPSDDVQQQMLAFAQDLFNQIGQAQ
jgi:hypothetical protein